MEDCAVVNMENKKGKNHYQANKKTTKKNRNSIIEKILRKEIMLIIELRICQTQIEKEKKEYMKNYYSKRKKLLNHLINCVKELENICLS